MFRDYTKSDYSLQKETWESFSSVGEADIKLAHTLEEGMLRFKVYMEDWLILNTILRWNA